VTSSVPGRTIKPGLQRLPLLGCLLAFVAQLILGGCSLTPPVPKPLIAESLLWQALDRQQQAFSSLRGLAKIRVENFTGPQSSTQVVLVEKPDRFRAEVLSMFGQPLLSVASDGQQLSVSIPSRRQFFQGTPNAENLLRFTRIPLEMTDLVHLLLHQVPQIDAHRSYAEPGPSLVIEGAEGYRQRLDFDHALTLVGATYFDQASRPWMTVRYTDFAADARMFPQRVEIDLPQAEVAAQVTLSELEINPVLSADKFRLSVPAGSTVQLLP